MTISELIKKGMIELKNADIENTGETTYSSPTSSCDCVAGLVGYIGGNNSIFTDITIYVNLL